MKVALYLVLIALICETVALFMCINKVVPDEAGTLREARECEVSAVKLLAVSPTFLRLNYRFGVVSLLKNPEDPEDLRRRECISLMTSHPKEASDAARSLLEEAQLACEVLWAIEILDRTQSASGVAAAERLLRNVQGFPENDQAGIKLSLKLYLQSADGYK